MKKLLLVGGGGHCKSIIDCLEEGNEYTSIGIVDSSNNNSFLYSQYPLVGTDDDLHSLYDEGFRYAFISIGGVGEANKRQKIYDLIKSIGFEVPIIQSKSAIVSSHAAVLEGTFIGKRAVLNTGAQIGTCSIINTGAIVEHDCEIGSFAHIAPGAILCGSVKIGDGVHIGAGSVVRQGVTIEMESVIGAGSVIVKHIKPYSFGYGNPFKEVEK